ncbi:MAG: DNA replication/repair protein RecF [Clostridiales bacterium]|nr:DNA replication/repair protein RecF [Clostridiales bacterium]
MHIARIRLQNFRSYQSLDFQPAPNLCVLAGENAAGKTNILESLFLCALGRSHRTRHDGELIRYGEARARVGLALQGRTGAHEIACDLFREGRRALRIDGMPLTRSGELLGHLRVVMFSPEDLRLIKQGPSERRRFMDMELSQLNPAYYYRLQQYNLALKQRNALLRDGLSTAGALDPWDTQLAQLGAAIMRERHAFMGRIAVMAAQLHNELAGDKETLRVNYEPSTPLDEEKAQAAALLKALRENAIRDKERGGTSHGPHRDDVSILVNGMDARAFGSQGQQRTAALSLKLSELTLTRELGGESPVLLLDDVLSELDGHRQHMLASAMRGCQTFLTCTRPEGLKDAGVGDMAVYRVHNGMVQTA